MENREKQKKLAETLMNIGVFALFAWIGWGLTVGLFLLIQNRYS